jgi:hypothetical protein
MSRPRSILTPQPYFVERVAGGVVTLLTLVLFLGSLVVLCAAVS